MNSYVVEIGHLYADDLNLKSIDPAISIFNQITDKENLFKVFMIDELNCDKIYQKNTLKNIKNIYSYFYDKNIYLNEINLESNMINEVNLEIINSFLYKEYFKKDNKYVYFFKTKNKKIAMFEKKNEKITYYCQTLSLFWLIYKIKKYKTNNIITIINTKFKKIEENNKLIIKNLGYKTNIKNIYYEY